MLRKPVSPLPVAASTSFAVAECGAAVNSTFLLCPNELVDGRSECGYSGCRWKQTDPTTTHYDTSLSRLECGMAGGRAR
jgi:hypothetical protein